MGLSMKWEAPGLVLTILLTAAGLCLLAGLFMARQERSVRVDRPREAHATFVEDLRGELTRLEQLYESHLDGLVSKADVRDEFALRESAGRIIGVRQVSLLNLPAQHHNDRHWRIGRQDNKRFPVPVFDADASPLGGPAVVLDRDRLVGGGSVKGWIDEPGKPLFYWQQGKGNKVVVILISLEAAQEAVNGWLRGWLPEPFAAVAAGKGPDRVRGPGETALIDAGFEEGPPEDGRPHMLIPVKTRFGTWHLASWDAVRHEVVYQMPMLVGSVALAGILAIMGVVAYGHQRRATKLAQTRVSFVNQVSHELRSPLTNILLNADLATDFLDHEERARKCLHLIQDEAHRLGRLIANVLTFSRMETNRHVLEMAPCSPDDVVDDVLAQFASSLERHDIVLARERGADRAVLVDRDALFQIMANLISNVQKYAAGGRSLHVQTGIKGNRLHIRVADRGPGIRARDRERIFQSFVRLDQRLNEGVSGTGLGLTIARGLARELGGELTLVASEHGAVFEVTLPAAPAGQPCLS